MDRQHNGKKGQKGNTDPTKNRGENSGMVSSS